MYLGLFQEHRLNVECLIHSRLVGGASVAHSFSFLCYVCFSFALFLFCFVFCFPVFVGSMSCSQCCLCLWIVHVRLPLRFFQNIWKIFWEIAFSRCPTLQCVSAIYKRFMTEGQGYDYGVYRHFQQYFSYIVAIIFIVRGNQSTRGNPPTCSTSLTSFIS